ncbi:N-acetylglucosamine-6-phosphate deacetylase protein [Halorhabdus tiamatea SARL4B]|uniref:Metal-dependent hydrolase involved in phosphonate metabolism, PhnM protein n=1 Tax=Halorhabdus tiamatea SARL4B TaxID=1033806 RepID=F7PPP7_9EURY|nr:alpha-D-ribose 1-methylphosphonate 5-triphosphate diphosphatase [Halorhabdus tiamatea]ERJ06584.1 N-acetylglucosamine-6-phosphate deacetylase protein [Halorhabdus tiamatea SARL4B]CCQ32250.1 metal-dependent hydrolase involved in phosphonate metabolism, PhnM protein [Halorhabdus tiamatea SARL4B]
MSSQYDEQVSTATTVIENARIVTPTDVIEGAVRIEGDRLAGIGDVDRQADQRIDAEGCLVLPGLIDLHGDDIETELYPRSGARMDTGLALAGSDRANVAAGITTKFHAISFEVDHEADRSPEIASEITAAVRDSDDLIADHRIHARCEVTQEESVDAVTAVINDETVSLVSVMSHVPGKGQFEDEEAFRQYYQGTRDHSVEEIESIIQRRQRPNIETIRDRVTDIVSTATHHNIPVASHDDENTGEVEHLADVGVDISEYPITLETAQRAHDIGMTVTMGAPNLVRGESQWGNLRTADTIEAGAVDALVADYYPMSLLAAPFVDTGESLPTRVARVTKNPAEAVGLTDRGRIVEDARADLVVVDEEPTPTVVRAFVAGDPVYHAEGTQ